MKSLTLFALCTLFALACGERRTVNGIEVYEDYWQATLNEIGPRAVYELGCGYSQLRFDLLQKKGKLPFDVMVSGCGRTGRYTRSVGAHHKGQWSFQPFHGPSSEYDALAR